MNQKNVKRIEILEEKMMAAWNRSCSNMFGGLGNALRIHSRCAYDADKRKILKKKRWDKECDKFLKKMKKEIKKYS